MYPERINIPEDNSCVFNAIYYLLQKETAPELRQVVASIILSNPGKYSSIYLGKDVDTYVEEILNPDQWGGAIELQILAEYYKTEIMAFSIETGRFLTYGEGLNYSNRIYLIYNGIHYDALVIKLDRKSDDPKDFIKVFPCDELEYFELLNSLVQTYHQKGDYINLNKFVTECQICYLKLENSIKIQEHAQNTGHTSFREVRN